MKRLITISLLILSASISYSQSLKKYAISKSGCSVYTFCNPGNFELSKSPDSSEVYTGECTTDNVSYGVICVKLNEPMKDLQVSEDVLIQYLDYLKTTMNIVSAAGYGKGHRLKDKENTRGVIDYWKDKEENNWKVKGWTNGKYIVVLYVYSKKEVPETKANVFLDGLVFPG